MLTCPVCASVRIRTVRVPTGDDLLRCAGCRLLFAPELAAPTPPRARLTERERRLEERVAQHRTPHFVRLLRTARRPGRLLDVGTGVGTLLELAGAAGWQAVGIDVDPAVVAHARAHGLDARLGELAAHRFPEASFDLVTVWNALDLVPAPVALLGECHRVLAPGGRLFVRTPNAPVQHVGVQLARALAMARLGRLAGARRRALGIFHVSNFGAGTLRIALARAGFTAITVRNSPPTSGDPYLGLDGAAERLLGLGKRLVFGAAQAAAVATAGRWLLSPSLEAWATRSA